MDCCVALLEKAKKTKQFLHDLALSSKDKNLAQYCNTSSWFEKKSASETMFSFLFARGALIDV